MSDQLAEILTSDEVAAYLKGDKCTVYRLTARGKRLAFKPDGTWCFRRGELGQWTTVSRVGKAMVDDDVGAE